MQAHIHIVSLSSIGDPQSLLQHLQVSYIASYSAYMLLLQYMHWFHPKSFILHIFIILLHMCNKNNEDVKNEECMCG